MDDILNLSIAEMPGRTFECSCGRTHSVDINRIIVGYDLSSEVFKAAADFKNGSVFLMADDNTYRVYGSTIEKLLLNGGLKLKTFVFKTDHPLVPDERALGRLLVEIGKDTSVIVAVGSGSINDLARILSCKLSIPYMIVCTAPSMDGYASVVSPLIIDGFKTTYEAVYPYAIFADINVLKEAPIEMLHAGFGDIIGKLTALADWELAAQTNGEYYCQTSVKLVRNALGKCIDNAHEIESRDPRAVESIVEALILSGVAMGLVGNSRPASGAEHHMAHYWEMDALAKGEEHPLHGNSVGAAAVVVSSLYELMNERQAINVEVSRPEEIRNLLRMAGANDNPAGLGISRELFKRSVLHAMEVRPRYTIYHPIAKAGLLEQFADILTERFYGAGD